jgi:CheY-like chemotaxis protein
MKGDREKIIDTKCDAFISKPIDPERISEKIEKLVGKS